MDELLLCTVESFLKEYSETDQVYADFILLEAEETDPEKALKLGDVTFQGEFWPVWLVDCELNIRRAILEERNSHTILVLSTANEFVTSIPTDVKARSHQRGLIPIGLRHRLMAETNREWPREVNHDEWKETIRRHYDNLKALAPQGNLPVTKDELEILIVKSEFGIELARHNAPELIVALYRQGNRRSPQDLEFEIFKGQLALHQVDHPEIVSWIAQEPERVRSFLIDGAMMRVEVQAGLTPNWGDLQSLRGMLLQNLTSQELWTIIEPLIWASWEQLPINDKRHLISVVQRKFEEYQTVDIQYFNDMLPKSLKYKITITSNELSEGNRDSYSPEILTSHLFAGDERESLETLSLINRMLTWRNEFTEELGQKEAAIDWMTWYLKKGAYADLDALYLLLQGSAKLQTESERVLNLYWEIRNQINQSFAKSFLSNYEEVIYSKEIVGSHKLIERTILPVLEEDQRVLLVILDGLGISGLIHLVQGFADVSDRNIGVLTEFLGASILPSVTAASRKAIFLGECPVDPLDSEEVYEEKAKISEEKALKERLSTYTIAFHNRTTLSANDGKTSLFNDLLNTKNDLVALVLNEVDESLSGGVKPRLWDLADLGVFQEAVNDSLNAGRRVFLTSDHGHTWHLSKEHRQGPQVPGGGQRYHPIGILGQTPENTIATSDPNIVRSEGILGLAFLYKVGEYYGQVPMRGYHGGVGLEEVVIPCIELGFEGRSLEYGPESLLEYHHEDQPTRIEGSNTGIVLELQDGTRMTLDLSNINSDEIRIVQLIAKFGQMNEQQLRIQMKTRRVAGIVSNLIEKLANEGLEIISVRGSGAFGNEYEFKMP